MLQFLIARDTMHQNQWLAAIEELGGHEGVFPIPNSHPQAEEKQEFSYSFFSHKLGEQLADGRWSSGPSVDGKGEFKPVNSEPLGPMPDLGPARPKSGAQTEQM